MDDTFPDHFRAYLAALPGHNISASEEKALAADIRSAQDLQAGRTITDDPATPTACARARSGRTNRLIVGNLRLVVSTVRGMGPTRGDLDIMDAIQEGNLGLMRAVEKFDPGFEAKFATYAVWWIRQGVARAIADQGRVVRLPVHIHDKVRTVQAALRMIRRRLTTEKVL